MLHVRLGKYMLVVLPFLPFPLPSLPFSQTSCISTTAEQHPATLIPPAGQQITDQVDHLPIAWGAAVCGRSLGSWGFSI